MLVNQVGITIEALPNSSNPWGGNSSQPGIYKATMWTIIANVSKTKTYLNSTANGQYITVYGSNDFSSFTAITTSGTARKEYMIYGDASSGFTTGVYFRAEDLEGFATANLTYISGNLSYYFYKKDNYNLI